MGEWPEVPDSGSDVKNRLDNRKTMCDLCTNVSRK